MHITEAFRVEMLRSHKSIVATAKEVMQDDG